MDLWNAGILPQHYTASQPEDVDLNINLRERLKTRLSFCFFYELLPSLYLHLTRIKASFLSLILFHQFSALVCSDTDEILTQWILQVFGRTRVQPILRLLLDKPHGKTWAYIHDPGGFEPAISGFAQCHSPCCHCVGPLWTSYLISVVMTHNLICRKCD